MEKRLLCMFRARTWGSTFGAIQGLGSLTVIIVLSFLLDKQVTSYMKFEGYDRGSIIRITLLSLELALMVSNVVMAGILLVGSMKETTSLLTTWRLYAIISSICSAVLISTELTLAALVYISSMTEFILTAVTVVLFVLGVSAQGFVFGLVGTHREEIVTLKTPL